MNTEILWDEKIKIESSRLEEIELEKEEPCYFCEGSGEIDTPAENIGGNIIGPDSRPCPICQNNEPEYEEGN